MPDSAMVASRALREALRGLEPEQLCGDDCAVLAEELTHFGRYIPAELRTALELGGPPAFDGVVCVDCGKRHGIELDHVDPVANGGRTTQRNLTGRCYGCHQQKTDQDRRAGLLGNGTGLGGGGGREPP